MVIVLDAHMLPNAKLGSFILYTQRVQRRSVFYVCHKPYQNGKEIKTDGCIGYHRR